MKSGGGAKSISEMAALEAANSGVICSSNHGGIETKSAWHQRQRHGVAGMAAKNQRTCVA